MRPIHVLPLAILTICSTAALAAPASTLSRRLERPTSVQVEGGLVLGVPSAEQDKLAAGSFGLGVAHALNRRLSLEASVARILNERAGTQAGLALRLNHPFGVEDRWAVYVSAGPAATFGAAFGRTVLARAELGLELRTRSGFLASYAMNGQTTLTQTPAGATAATHLERGDTGIGWRLCLGYAF